MSDAVSLSNKRICDITLACAEALANCAKHAYRNDHSAGTVDLHLVYDGAAQLLNIDARPGGTTVRMQFGGCPPARR